MVEGCESMDPNRRPAKLVIQASDDTFIAIPQFNVDLLENGKSILRNVTLDRRPGIVEVFGLYAFQSLEIVVKAKGYLPQRRSTVLAPADNSAAFILGKQGMAFYEQGGVPVPFRKKEVRHVLLKPQEGAGIAPAFALYLKKSKNLAAKPIEAKSAKPQQGKRVKNAKLRAQEFPWHKQFVAAELTMKGAAAERTKAARDVARRLRAHPEEGRIAILLKERAEGASFFTGEIRVTFSVLLEPKEISRFTKKHALHVARMEGAVFVFEMDYPSVDFPDLVAQIRKDPRVKEVEAIVISTPEIDAVVPTDYLFQAQWDHQIIRTPDAWDLLQGAIGVNSQFGSNNVILAVADPFGVQVLQPDLDGNVNGVPKLFAAFDFAANNVVITLGADHGTACATAAAGAANRPAAGNPAFNEGTVGIAGGVLVVLARVGGVDQGEMYRWYTGFTVTNPAKLGRSVDITNNSYGSPGAITAAERFFLEHASDFGRLGRGLVMFYSAGNANTTIVSQRRLASFPRTICITASTLTVSGTIETKAAYSNFGPEAGVCALSDSSLTSAIVRHNPPASWGAICGTVTNAAAAGLGIITAQGNIPGFPALSGGVPVRQALAPPLTPVGSPTLTTTVNTAPFAGLTAVLVEPAGALNSEGLMLTAPGPGPQQLSVRYSNNFANTQKTHAPGVNVDGGPADYSTEFGGTSYSTPVVAGIAALILSAKNALSWVEVREILRNTSRKINVGETSANGLWRDPALTANNTVLNAAGTDVRPKSPAVTTTLAANAVAPNNALAHLNHGQSTLQLTNAAGFDLGDAIRLSDGVHTDFHVIEGKAGNNIIIDALRHNFGTAPATTVKAGLVKPIRSDFYGFGRVNAALAVRAAIAYNHADRDLVIRNHLADTGLPNINPAVNPIHSPDIWLRNQNDPTLPAPPYDQPGPHQNPVTGSNRFIYARIKNIGTRLTNLDAWVHFYVALSDHGIPPVDPNVNLNVNPAPGIATPFLFPGDPASATGAIANASWCDIQANDITNGATGITTDALKVYHVRDTTVPNVFNQLIPAGSVSAADPNNINTGVTVVNVQWNQANLPPAGTAHSIYLLVYVSPVDGPRQGREAGTNSNMSFREIAFADFHLNDNTGAAALPSSVNVDQFGTPVVTQFRFRFNQTVGSFLTERLVVEITRTNDNGSKDRAIFRNVAGVWQLADQGGGAVTWAHVTAPVDTVAGTPVAGRRTDVYFAGDFSCAMQQQKVVFHGVINSARPGAVLVPIAEDSFEVQVIAPAPASPFIQSTDPVQPTPDSFVFTDFATLQTQTVARAFGPLDANRFRVTSVFTANAAPRAYAICPGVVMVQRVDANRVNLVLRPLRQAGLGMTPVKYYIYRGLRLDHFLTAGDNSLVRPQAGAPDFVARLWPIHIAQNPGPPPFTSVALGYDPGNQADADKIDKFFFAAGASIQYALAKAGEWLGDFFHTGGNEFGLEIVLEEGTAQPTFQNIRQTTNIIDVSALPATNDTERLTKRLAQEEILNYMDPAAFYALHFDGTVRRIPNGTWTDQAVVTNVVNKFATKTRVYIDIRNENGNSYNFYQNYKGPAGQPDTGMNIRFGVLETALTTASYGTQGWPLHIVDLSQATPDLKNPLVLQLRWDDNLKPVLYVENGEVTSSTINNRFVDDTLLFTPPPPIVQPWTDSVTFRSPNTGAGTKPSIAWLFKMHYGRMIDATTVWPATVVHTEKTLDNLFGPLDLAPLWSGDAPIRWIAAQDRKYVDGQALNFGQMMERGVAFEGTLAAGRVIFFAALTDLHKNLIPGFRPRRGVTGGTSGAESFLQAAKRFDQYRLEFGSLPDAGTPITTLRFEPGVSSDPTIISGVMVLGITSAEYTRLQGLAGLNNAYPRTVFFQAVPPDPFPNLKKFKIGVQGLKADGTTGKVMPAAGSEVFVYSVDSLTFASDAFAKDEPLPTLYTRNVEESVGQMNLEFPGAASFVINAVTQGANGQFRVAGDLRQLITRNGKFQVTGSANNNGSYTVTDISFAAGAGITSLTVANVPGNSASGSLQLLPRKIEEHFIELDPSGIVAGTNPMRSVVDNFRDRILLEPNAPGATAALRGHINDFGAQVLARARATVRDATHANADDRPLYWARLFMQATLKSHPFLLQNFAERDILTRLLENVSRGIDPAPSFTGATAGDKKVLIVGFDPFFVVPGRASNNTHQSNPSGVAALYLHANPSAVANMFIQSVILPVRFEDFDQGILDKLVDAYLQGGNRPDMILSISQDTDLFFHVDRFATRFRTAGIPDNMNVMNKAAIHYELNAAQNGLDPLATNANLPRFLETTLPVARLVPGSVMSAAAHGTEVVKTVRFDQTFQMLGSLPPPVGTDDNQSVFAGLVPTPGVEVEQGSGGNYLSNELFYRICWRRTQRNTTLKSGHLHVPKLQSDSAGPNPLFDAARVKYFLDTIASILNDAKQGI